MTLEFMLVRSFPNGQSYRVLKLYASDATALAGCKRLFRYAEPGESLTLIRKGGEVAFKLERPLALSGPVPRQEPSEAQDTKGAETC